MEICDMNNEQQFKEHVCSKIQKKFPENNVK